jgi:hypothetical protein
MASSQKSSALFAMLFSDLMMGAMGVIIVLLVFLQVVSIRGSGEFEAERALEFPPGMDMNTFPVVRVRIEYCSSDTSVTDDTKLTKLVWNGRGDDVREYVMHGAVGGDLCEYRIFHFTEGLGGQEIELHAVKADNAQATEINIQVSVAGFIEQERNFSHYSRDTPFIAVISLDKREVISGI